MVCAALVRGGHICGSAPAFRCRDAASVVGQGHCPHHASVLGLFSLVTVWADEALKNGWKPRRAAWYAKSHLTFSDALAIVRAKVWSASFETSRQDRDEVKIPRALLNRLTEAACFPA